MCFNSVSRSQPISLCRSTKIVISIYNKLIFDQRMSNPDYCSLNLKLPFIEFSLGIRS